MKKNVKPKTNESIWKIGAYPIYLSTAEGVCDEVVQEHNINTVISLRVRTSRIPTLSCDTENPLTHLKYRLNDKDSACYQTFITAGQALTEQLTEGRTVLVHCKKGISRSVSVIMFFLMNQEHLSFDQALSLIKIYRPKARPHAVFKRYLQRYQREHDSRGFDESNDETDYYTANETLSDMHSDEDGYIADEDELSYETPVVNAYRRSSRRRVSASASDGRIRRPQVP